MPNRQQKNKQTSGDLVGNKATRLGVPRSGGRAECLCHVYAHVLRDIGNILGAAEDQNGRSASNEPKSEEAIQNMIKALEEIHFELSRFKVNSRIRESCPQYSDMIYSDINELIPRLAFVISLLTAMVRIYNIVNLDPLKAPPEHFNTIVNAINQYKNCLLQCRTCIIEINTQVKWWRERLSPQGCLGQRAAG